LETSIPINDIFFRLITLLLIIGIALTGFLAALTNLSEPQSNFAFIKHIMSMDTTYQTKGCMWRAVNNPILQRTAFSFIIILEILVAIFGIIGSYQLTSNLLAIEPAWETAKFFCYLSLFVALFIWFFIFQVIGAEWFSSWQSEHWNGIRDSMRINLIAIAGVLFLHLS
jgi:predicted small integral membrane protein